MEGTACNLKYLHEQSRYVDDILAYPSGVQVEVHCFIKTLQHSFENDPKTKA